MLNSKDEIRSYWPPENADIDDETRIGGTTKTAYDLFIETTIKAVARRLKKWIGTEAYDDAIRETPVNPERAEAVKEAELQLIHIEFIEKLWRDKSAGAERDVQFPSGMRITLEAFSFEAYMEIIRTHVGNADRAVMEYIL